MQPVTNKWTCCSNADFKIVYDQWQPFCLDPCSGGPPPATTTAPPPDCKPEYLGDGYCDDCHNTVEGNYDGGDCCPPHPDLDYDEWDTYCTKCECLQPTTTTTATTTTAG